MKVMGGSLVDIDSPVFDDPFNRGEFTVEAGHEKRGAASDRLFFKDEVFQRRMRTETGVTRAGGNVLFNLL